MNRPTIKDEETYEVLRDKGYPKEKAARIANSQADDSRNPSEKGGQQPPYPQWTKKALYDRARELDIDGRSNMSKDQLIAALRE